MKKVMVIAVTIMVVILFVIIIIYALMVRDWFIFLLKIIINASIHNPLQALLQSYKVVVPYFAIINV